MKLGLGLNPHTLNQENFRFARQAGATHIVAHLNTYQQGERAPGSKYAGGGLLPDPRPPWTYEELRDLKHAVSAEGLVLEAIENFDPCHWHDVLLDGPQKREQMEGVKQIIRDMGRAGIPIMGYNFSIAGVWGHVHGECRARRRAVGRLLAPTARKRRSPTAWCGTWSTTRDCPERARLPPVTP